MVASHFPNADFSHQERAGLLNTIRCARIPGLFFVVIDEDFETWYWQCLFVKLYTKVKVTNGFNIEFK